MNTDYFVTKITGDAGYLIGATGVRAHRKEAGFCEAMIAIQTNFTDFDRALLNARWYHHPRSRIWHCCVWINLPTQRGEHKGNGFYTAGGASAPLTYGGDSKIISFQRAINAAGIEFVRPEKAHTNLYTCNIKLEDYFRGVLNGLLDDLKRKEFDVPQYVVAHAHP
jgi:hypothetical protein